MILPTATGKEEKKSFSDTLSPSTYKRPSFVPVLILFTVACVTIVIITLLAVSYYKTLFLVDKYKPLYIHAIDEKSDTLIVEHLSRMLSTSAVTDSRLQTIPNKNATFWDWINVIYFQPSIFS